MALFAGNLLPASFRGALFAVLSDDVGGGRRIVVHQYPGRDAPWAEDMGRAARTFHFRGFIVDGDVIFASGPIQLQRALLLAAFEAKGSGLLTHPTLGVLSVSVTRFAIGQDLGAGRMSSIEVEFVESGSRQFPSLLATSGLASAAVVMAAALALDGVRAIAAASAAGARRKDLATTGATWASKATALGADATALNRLAAQLPGSYGRFAGGANVGAGGARAVPYTASTTIADLVEIASASRVAIGVAATGVAISIAQATLAYPADLPAAVRTLVAALVAACADPGDALRLLEQLLGYVPARPEALSAIGAAFGWLVRRAAVEALTGVVGQYQPASRDDAALLIARLVDLVDPVIEAAADVGDDASYKAARTVRAAIVTDLRWRGAGLASVRTFAPGAGLPSLVLAQRYYRDAARADQLEVQTMPVHPLFLPARFQALAA
ncbi:DNA circularization N-terminal domain-containing protein [Sphingomonas bacterium]|uniref:DNA circularization N-terminal domain-containing protein n=1 Tax=Sphingomonas bacterium TaxID=1895847 RepID=UPI001576A98B|nr:DNA circularization N-terminal domain-containing protein [Sphingomonas bacterium]